MHHRTRIRTRTLTRTRFSRMYTVNVMAATTVPSSSSIHTDHSTLNKIPRLTQFHVTASLSLKDACKRGSLKLAFESLATVFADRNSQPGAAYGPVLELCASKKALSQGQQVHAHLIKSYVTCDSEFLSTKLVFMYGKCGSLRGAEKVFDEMPQRSVFTWNAMIGAYVTNGEHVGALDLYRDMRVSGVTVDAYTLPCVLKACGAVRDVRYGAQVHGFVVKSGYISTVFVVNSLVALYAKCEDLDKARQLFDDMIVKGDVVSWNSIISACIAKGRSQEALRLFRDMQKTGCAMNSYTYVAALQVCDNPSFRKLGMEIHAAMLKSTGNDFDAYMANALVSMYVRCGNMDEAARLFGNMDKKDIISWNSMLSGFVQNGLYGKALKFFNYMQGAGQRPDPVSITSIVAASGRLGNLLNGMELHAYAVKTGLDSNLQVGNTLIDMYAKCCCINYMGHVFERMREKDCISWTTIIACYAQNNGYAESLELFRKAQTEGIYIDAMMIGSMLLICSGLKSVSYVKQIQGYITRRGLYDLMLQNSLVDVYGDCGNVDYAARLFELIEFKDVVSWTSMISCYVENGMANEALRLFCLMKEAGIEPDFVALVTTLSAAASLSALKKGKEIHGFLVRKGFIFEGSVGSSLLDMYARCGTIESVYKIFDCIRNKDLCLWTTMINANGMHGRGREAIDVFNRMVLENLVPDHVTFLALLNACSHSGLIDEGIRFLESMRCVYQLEPWPEHYACLVDLLGRANRIEEAYQFVTSMPVEPTAEVWCALLGACRIHSNEKIGEIAAQKLVELDPENPGHYVLVSNVFAANGRWKDVEEVRMKMRGSGLKKSPGCSWIEVRNKVHTFMARDKSHPESSKIYQKLEQVIDKLEKDGGYVAQTKFVLHNLEEDEKVRILYAHSERLAIAYGLLKTPEETPIRITKNLRVCGDCHTFCKLVSKFFERKLIVRDANRFHHFENGICSCGDFW